MTSPGSGGHLLTEWGFELCQEHVCLAFKIASTYFWIQNDKLFHKRKHGKWKAVNVQGDTKWGVNEIRSARSLLQCTFLEHSFWKPKMKADSRVCVPLLHAHSHFSSKMPKEYCLKFLSSRRVQKILQGSRCSYIHQETGTVKPTSPIELQGPLSDILWSREINHIRSYKLVDMSFHIILPKDVHGQPQNIKIQWGHTESLCNAKLRLFLVEPEVLYFPFLRNSIIQITLNYS